MNIVDLIKNSDLMNKKIPLIIAIHIIAIELNKNNNTKLLPNDFMSLMNLSHEFYSTNDKEKRNKLQEEIANILEIYSRGENSIYDIENELSKLTRI